MKYIIWAPYRQEQIIEVIGWARGEIEAESDNEALQIFRDNLQGYVACINEEGINIECIESNLYVLESEEIEVDFDKTKIEDPI